MEFKKCVRCGCFFMSDNDVCYNCESKDKFDIAKLNNIIDENVNLSSIDELSSLSGIKLTNINRFIENNKIDNFNNLF